MQNKKRIPAVAAALSLVTPGLGQLYNGQISKGIFLFLATFLVPAILFLIGLPRRFPGLVAIFVLSIGVWLFAVVEAFFAAKRRSDFTLKGYNRWFVYLVIIILMAGASFNIGNINTNFASGVLGYKYYGIKTGSMEPTLMTGDKLITDTKYFKKNTPQRGDLVIIQDPNNPSMNFIKRVIALEGEKIEIKKKQVYINDSALPKSGLVRDDVNADVAQRDNFGPELVPAGHCFVLGDNRDNSAGSRIWGPLPLSSIKGKPLYVYWAKDKSRIGKKLK